MGLSFQDKQSIIVFCQNFFWKIFFKKRKNNIPKCLRTGTKKRSKEAAHLDTNLFERDGTNIWRINQRGFVVICVMYQRDFIGQSIGGSRVRVSHGAPLSFSSRSVAQR